MKFPSPYDHILPEDIPCIEPPQQSGNFQLNDRIRGSMLGLATGDAVGASVEFLSHQYLLARPVHTLQSGGTWGLKAGQWTDDTSMSLCLASSLITAKTFDPYSQMVRYKWWYKHGFLSSTGQAFDIGTATRQALHEFSKRQKILQKKLGLKTEAAVDRLSFQQVKNISDFDVNCSSSDSAGNGALMRLAPIALFFFRNPTVAVELSGRSARSTHGSRKAIDACRYYGALIVATLRGETKEQLLNKHFYENHREWFGTKALCNDVLRVALGSYKKPGGYSMGIRGTGYVIDTLEAALWAFWSDNNSFRNGTLAVVNLGDDTDTTAAVYGQLAGAYYGSTGITRAWLEKLYAKDLIVCISDWLEYLGRYYGLAADTHYHKVTSIPSISQRKHLLMMADTPNGLFLQSMPRESKQIKKYDPRFRFHAQRQQYLVASQPLVWSQHPQASVGRWATHSTLLQLPHGTSKFYY